jgi:hypothetical protein
MIKFMLNSIIVVLFITIVLPVFVAVGLAVLMLVAR